DLEGVVGVWQTDAAGNWRRAKAFTVAPQSIAVVRPSPIFPFFVVHRRSPPIRLLALSQDGPLLPAPSQSVYRAGFSLLNLADDKVAPALYAADAPSNWASMLRSIAFSPRGDMMAAGLAGESLGAVLVWDVATRKVRRTLRPGFGEVYHVGFSADAKYL